MSKQKKKKTAKTPVRKKPASTRQAKKKPGRPSKSKPAVRKPKKKAPTRASVRASSRAVKKAHKKLKSPSRTGKVLITPSKNPKSKLKISKSSSNRFNKFQKVLGEFLRSRGIKLKQKFHIVAKTIYSEIDPSVHSRGFESYIETLYQKFYANDLLARLEELGIRTAPFPFYEAIGEFSLSGYLNFNLDITFDDGTVQDHFSGSSEEFFPWYTSKAYNDSSASRGLQIKPGALMGYLRNNYNNSPVAEFRLENQKDNWLFYQIVVEQGITSSPDYIPMGAPPEMRDKAWRDEQEAKKAAGKGAKGKIPLEVQREQIALEREQVALKTKEVQLEKAKEIQKLIRSLKKLGYSDAQIRKKIDKLE